MKATEFVKKFGWKYAKGIIIACESGFLPKNQNYEDIKHLVESHMIIELIGGIEKAIDTVINLEAHGRPMPRLAQAIADVEACQ